MNQNQNQDQCPDCGGPVQDQDGYLRCGFTHDGTVWSCG
jgi:hypothetical protein